MPNNSPHAQGHVPFLGSKIYNFFEKDYYFYKIDAKSMTGTPQQPIDIIKSNVS